MIDTGTAAEAYIKNNFLPSHEECNKVDAMYDELKKVLSQQTFRTGSYRRGTATSPVNDLDVIHRMNVSSVTEAEKKLKETHSILKDHYGEKAKVVLQSHSIGIFFGEEEDFSIDVVPAFPSDEKNEFGEDIFYVPEIAHRSIHRRRDLYKLSTHKPIEWIKSDPKGYIKWATNVQEANAAFRSATALLKKWRRGAKEIYSDEFSLKSFHIELIVGELAMNDKNTDCLRIAALFLEKLKPYYIDQRPHFKDRADNGKYVDDYEISERAVELIDTLAKSALLILKKIQNASTEADIETMLIQLVTIRASYKHPISSPHKPWCSPLY